MMKKWYWYSTPLGRSKFEEFWRKGSLRESKYRTEIERIADAYAAAPSEDPRAVDAWLRLADDSAQRAAAIKQKFNVGVTDDPEPYADAQEMFDHLNQGEFIVSRANSDHPIWTPEQNVDFRLAHDILGHYPSGGDFSWHGENDACNAHARHLDPLSQQALMTECLGQTGFAIHNGGFGDQKMAFLEGYNDPWAWQRSAKIASEGNHPCCYRSRWAGGWPPQEHVASIYQSFLSEKEIEKVERELQEKDGDEMRRVLHPTIDDYPDHRQWLVNIGESDTPGSFARSKTLSEKFRNWLMENYSREIVPTVPQNGYWDDPENDYPPVAEPSAQGHFINVPKDRLKEIIRHYGEDNPGEYAFGILPFGEGKANSVLWKNPFNPFTDVDP